MAAERVVPSWIVVRYCRVCWGCSGASPPKARLGPGRNTPGQIRLMFNENPYGPSPTALAEVAKILPMTAYYPDQIENDLMSLFIDRHNLDRDQVFLASGSNEGLQAAMIAFGKHGKVISPALTYSDHLLFAEKLGVDVQRIPLCDDMSIDLEAMARAVDDSVSLVYLCNPNNPTGMAIDGDELRSFCRELDGRVPLLIDEAYNELTDKPDYTSMVDLVRGGANILITRTFSKIFGMAGLRVGYGMGHPHIVSVVKDNVMAWPNGVGFTRLTTVTLTRTSLPSPARRCFRVARCLTLRSGNMASNRFLPKQALFTRTSAETLTSSRRRWPLAT